MRSHWLRQRLGVAGRPRDEIVASLRARLRAPVLIGGSPASSATVPLDRDHLDAVTLARLAQRFPGRGDAGRLGLIAAWGGAVCWIVQGRVSRATVAEREAAAAFNLAVALFDTALERDRAQRRQLTAALHPTRLAARLAEPHGPGLVPARDEHAELVALFDRALRLAGERWHDEPAHLDRLARLLAEMYRSETHRWADPGPAKHLPVVFLGAIATDDPAELRLCRHLGGFVAAWDDWLDQDEDLLGLRPNAFLGRPNAAAGLGLVPYALRGVYRVAAGPRAAEAVRGGLDQRLRAVLDAADEAAPPTATRTHAFLDRLVA